MRKLIMTPLVAAGLVLAALPQTAAGSDGPRIERLGGSVRIAIDPADRRPWTPERMARAVPVDMNWSPDDARVGRSASAPTITVEDLSAGPTPVLIPGTAPRGASKSGPGLDLIAKAGGLVQYQRSAVADPSAYPYSAHGKLYMVAVDGTESVCSASVVPSAHGMAVMTAGHCLVSPTTGVPVLDAVFVPGYLGNSDNPYSFWFAEFMYVTQEWYDSAQPGGPDPDARYDIAGFTVMQSPAYTTTLQDTVGSRGIAFNQPQGQSYRSIGFPAATPFDGEKMITCVSAPAVTDPTYTKPPMPNGMGCDMTGGSSGGGWVIEDEFINSVVSYAKKQFPQMQFGPYFGDVGMEMFENMSGLDYPDTPTPDVEQFGTSIGMKLVKHLRAKGTVSSSNLACRVFAPVVIAKMKNGEAVAVAQTYSIGDGSYSVKVKDRPGKYVAVTLDSYRDSFTMCGGSNSKVIRHVH